jgi:hypothetical protein
MRSGLKDPPNVWLKTRMQFFCFITDSAVLMVLWNELINVFSCSTLVCPHFPQFDADRNEDEVFYDISVAVDNKLFPNKEATSGKSLCPLGSGTHDHQPNVPGFFVKLSKLL